LADWRASGEVGSAFVDRTLVTIFTFVVTSAAVGDWLESASQLKTADVGGTKITVLTVAVETAAIGCFNVDTLAVLAEVEGADILILALIIGAAALWSVQVDATLETHATVFSASVTVVTFDIGTAATHDFIVGTVTSLAHILGAKVTIQTVSVVHAIHNQFTINSGIHKVTTVNPIAAVYEVTAVNVETSVNEVASIHTPGSVIIRSGISIVSWEKGFGDSWVPSVPFSLAHNSDQVESDGLYICSWGSPYEAVPISSLVLSLLSLSNSVGLVVGARLYVGASCSQLRELGKV